MTDSLGLSVGATNLVAARVEDSPVRRRAILTLSSDHSPVVGLPDENPGQSVDAGVVLSGFVERVGDPVPLVAEDGSTHKAERVLVEALDVLAGVTAAGRPAATQVAIAVPAHWGPALLGALRGAVRAKPSLSPNGIPAALIPDSTAALTSLAANPGLPASGVVALLDFGGSGTTISLADAGSGLQPIGSTVRLPDAAGEQIDQALLNHVLDVITRTGEVDPSSTTAVGALTVLRDECRLAKERLSAETATVVHAELPGHSSDVRLTRPELEGLIGAPLGEVLTALNTVLSDNNIPLQNLAAVATVGGGANIPFVTQQVSERLRVPVVTTAQPQLNAAVGAALLAAQGPAADATAMGPAADAPTGMAPAAWAAGVASAAASESAAEGAPSATFRAMAWSEDDQAGEGVVPYTGGDYEPTAASGAYGAADPRPQLDFEREPETGIVEPPPLPWYRRPVVLFGAAAAALLLAVSGLVYTLTSESSPLRPDPSTSPPESGSAPSEAPPATSETVTVTGGDGRETVVTQPPPPAPTTTSDPSSTTAPTTTSSTTATTTTTTTTTPPTTTTTTRTTTTRTTPPVTTTQPPVTTTAPPPVTTTPPQPPPAGGGAADGSSVEPEPGGQADVVTPAANPQAPRLVSVVVTR